MLSVGSLMIQSRLLILIVSIVIAYYVVRWKLRSVQVPEELSRLMLDKFVNGVLIALIVWKFTPLLSEPSILWTRPRGLLAYTGGTLGIWLGFAAGLLYVYFALRRAAQLRPVVLDALAFGVLIVCLPMRLIFREYGMLTDAPWGISLNDPLLSYHPVHLYAGLAAVPIVAAALLARRSRWGTGTIARDIFAGLGLGWFVVSFFQRADAEILLTTEQWLLLALTVCGLAAPYAAGLIQKTGGEHTNDGKEMMDVVKETSMNSSPEQRKQARDNREEARQHAASQAVDKRLDGPNRPAE